MPSMRRGIRLASYDAFLAHPDGNLEFFPWLRRPWPQMQVHKKVARLSFLQSNGTYLRVTCVQLCALIVPSPRCRAHARTYAKARKLGATGGGEMKRWENAYCIVLVYIVVCTHRCENGQSPFLPSPSPFTQSRAILLRTYYFRSQQYGEGDKKFWAIALFPLSWTSVFQVPREKFNTIHNILGRTLCTAPGGGHFLLPKNTAGWLSSQSTIDLASSGTVFDFPCFWIDILLLYQKHPTSLRQ